MLKYLHCWSRSSIQSNRLFAFGLRERHKAAERIKRVKSDTPVSQVQILVYSTCLAALCYQLRFVHEHYQEKPVQFSWTTRRARRVYRAISTSQFFISSRANDVVPCVTQFRHLAPQTHWGRLVTHTYSVIYLLFSYSLKTYFLFLN